MKRAIVLVAVAALVARVRAAGFPTSFTPTTITTSASTSTSDSSSSTATPFFILGQPSPLNIDTCDESLTITWFYAGQLPVKNFTLSVTNINVTQSPPPASTTGGIVTGRQIIPSIASGSVISTGTVSAPSGSSTPLLGLIESLTTSLDPLAQTSFTWTQANLPQGWYQILATPTDAGDVSGGVGGIWSTFQRSSISFFIQNGSDVSCLAAIGTVTSSSSSGGSSTTSETATSGASTSTSIAVGSLDSAAHVNRGAIAGGVVGGVAVLIAVLGAYIVFRHGRRRAFSKDRNNLDSDPRNSAKPSFGKWGALGSFDSTKGSRSIPKDPVDPVTVLNTAANSRPAKPAGFGLGDMGLAALGLAKPQHQDEPPSPSTTKSKRNRSSRQYSGFTDSAGDTTASTSYNSSSFSADGHYDPYANLGVPMHNLSTPPAEENHQLDQKYQSYPPSSDSFSSGAPGFGGIPTAIHASSPFVTPPPSQPTSRHNSRSYSRTSLPSSSPTQTFAAFGHSDLTSSDSRARAQSQHASPPSKHALDLPDSPARETSPGPFIHHQKRASSPDALVYTQIEGSQTGSSKAKRTPRKPVPSYAPQDEFSAQPPSPSAPMSPVYTLHTSNNGSAKPVKAGPVRRTAPPPPPSESASSSSSSFHRLNPHKPHLHSLEHKESAHSLVSLRSMEGDMSGYGAVGKDGKKQMHVLIPDMPLPQSD